MTPLCLDCIEVLWETPQSLQKIGSDYKKWRSGELLGKTAWLQTTSGGKVHRAFEGLFSSEFSHGNHQDNTGVCSLRWVVTLGQFVIKIVSHSGKQKINIGNFSSFKSDEEIQQRKFLSLLNTLTINLLHSVLTHKMDYGKKLFKMFKFPLYSFLVWYNGSVWSLLLCVKNKRFLLIMS